MGGGLLVTGAVWFGLSTFYRFNTWLQGCKTVPGLVRVRAFRTRMKGASRLTLKVRRGVINMMMMIKLRLPQTALLWYRICLGGKWFVSTMVVPKHKSHIELQGETLETVTAVNVPLDFTPRPWSEPAGHAPSVSVNQQTRLQHPSFHHFHLASFFFGNVENTVAEGGVRSGFHSNCQPPPPPLLQLNTLFHRHGSTEARFPRRPEECSRECETARGRERANKFCENTVIQYGRHCVRANGGRGRVLGERRYSRVMINLQTRPGPWCKTASVQGVHVPRITPVSVTGSEFSSVPETATDTHTHGCFL